MKNKRILISGAGVAGPTLAWWLLKYGFEPTIVERAPELRTGGYVIDFWGLGYEIARRMGLESRLREAGYQVREVRVVNEEGKTVASVDTEPMERWASGGFTSLPRGDLAAAIWDALEGRAETLFGDTITSLEDHGEGVRVNFEHEQERDFDLVVGADGLHSNVRRLTFGPGDAFTKHMGYAVAACDVAGYEPRDELTYMMYTLAGRQVDRFSLRGGRTLFLFIWRRAPGEALPGDAAARKALLREKFGDAGWECPRILNAIEPVDDVYLDDVSQIRMPDWSCGRVALVGDAAACVSLLAGEGTGLGMTEAYVLAGELRRAGGRHTEAFAAYERELQGFLEDKQRAAESFASSFAPRTSIGVWMRNEGMRLMKFRPFAWLFLGRSLRDNFELPDYG